MRWIMKDKLKNRCIITNIESHVISVTLILVLACVQIQINLESIDFSWRHDPERQGARRRWKLLWISSVQVPLKGHSVNKWIEWFLPFQSFVCPEEIGNYIRHARLFQRVIYDPWVSSLGKSLVLHEVFQPFIMVGDKNYNWYTRGWEWKSSRKIRMPAAFSTI